MASRNMKAYDAMSNMSKLPSSTLKRHPKMDLNKNDLLRLLSYLEGELQARDISIAALKAEKAKQLLYQAKYGRFGLGDPFNALQRDSETQKDDSFNESAVKAMYDNQLAQLENLIATQRRAQHRMREQLVAVEKRYHKVLAELEEEKQKHEIDTAQGDDVTYMLEKDRERLKQALDFEKSQVKKLEKENKKLSTNLDDERNMSGKHKQVALVLIKERKHYMEKLAVFQHHNVYLDNILREDKSRLKAMQEGLAQEGHKSLVMEAAVEKQLSEFDIEREQLRGRLSKEELRNAELVNQIEQLQMQLSLLPAVRGMSPGGSQTGRGMSPGPTLMARSSPSASPKVFKDTRVPVVHVPMRNSPDLDSVSIASHVRHSSGDASRLVDINNGAGMESSLLGLEKPVPAQKPSELIAGRVISTSSGLYSPTPSSTVFTTPSGTRISLNVGSNVSSGGARKPLPVGRGVPPPLPPNKPQVYLPSGVTGIGRRDHMVRSSGGLPPANPPLSHSHLLSQQHNLQKLGITITKDKITISNPLSGEPGGVRPGQGRPDPRLHGGSIVQATGSGEPTASPTHKPSQVGLRY